MASSSSALPTAEVLRTWTTITDGLTHYGITADEWTPVATALGEEKLNDLSTLASIEDADYKDARDVVKLTPIKRGAFNMLFGATKLKFNLVTTVVQQISTGPSRVTSGPQGSDHNVEGLTMDTPSLEDAKPMTTVALVAKVKLSMIINQAIDQEIPMMSQELLKRARDRYIQTCGDEPLPSCAATDAQLTALNFLLDNGMAPYTDFAIFNPHGARVERKLKFVQHYMNAEGKWRASEVPGPATLDQWKSCWDVFAVAAISLDVVAPATLARYAKRFEERCGRYPLSWYICARAEDRCRAEWMPAERRRQERFAAEHPHIAVLDQGKPWNSVLREAADSIEYWTQELQEPALLHAATRAVQAPSFVRQQSEQQEDEPMPPPDKKKGKGKGGKHPRRSGTYYRTDKWGTAICVSFNRGFCNDKCKRAHLCSLCLGQHPSTKCGLGANKRQKTQAGAASSSKE